MKNKFLEKTLKQKICFDILRCLFDFKKIFSLWHPGLIFFQTKKALFLTIS
jgi:hypothetical protein